MRPSILFLLVTGFVSQSRAGEGAEPEGQVAHEWPMRDGDAGWTGYSPDPRVKPPFRLKWATKISAGGVALADGKVFAGGVCLDAETGKKLWRYSSYGFPVYHKGRLYLRYVSVRACDAATGKTLWRKGGGFVPAKGSGLAVCDGAIYNGQIKKQGDKKFYFATALSAEDGKEIWSTPLVAVEGRPPVHMSGMANIAVAGGSVVASTQNPKMVFALDQKTGKERWRREGICAQKAPSTDGKTVWLAESVQGVLALELKTGKELWHWGGTDKPPGKAHYEHTGTACHPPVVAYGMLFVSNYGRQYTALDAKTGKELWIAGDKGGHAWAGSCAPPVAAGGYLYTPGTVGKDFNGKLYRFVLSAVDAKTGKPVWKYPMDNKSCQRLSIANGRLYVTSGRGELCCFEPVSPDYKSEPQPPPKEPAGPLAALAKPFAGKPGETAAGGKPKGGADWPMYGGCPARCGLEFKMSLPLKEAWKFQTGGEVRSSPVIADGTAYAGNESGELFALDLATGKKKWSTKITPHPESKTKVKWIRSAPAVAKGIVVCGADDGVLRAFDAASGRPKWEFKTAGRIRSSPAIVGDRVIFGSWDGRCYCVRLSDGKEFWRWRVGDPGVRVDAPPVVAAGRVYVGAWEDHRVFALDLGTGKPLPGYQARSGYSTKLGLVQGLALYRGLVVTCRAAWGGQLIDPNSGGVVSRNLWLGWPWEARCLLPALPAFSGNRAYHPQSPLGAKLSAALASTKAGAKKKRRGVTLKHRTLNAPLVCGNLMVAATEKGTLEVYRLPDEKSDDPGKLVWDWKSPSGAEIQTAPAAGGGFIVLGSDDGHVYAFSYSGEK